MAGQPLQPRKSLLSQQAAKDGLSFNSSNVDSLLQDLPKNLKLSAASNKIRGPPARTAVSRNPKSTSLVTPVSRILPSRGGSAGSTHIPRRLNTNVGSSAVKGKPPSVGAGVSRAPLPSAARSTSRSDVRATVRSTVRRSISVESLADSTMNMFRTPMSKARSQSPCSTSKEKTTVTKLGKLPSSKDKEILTPMMEQIISVLSELNYGQEIAVSSFRSLGGTELQKIFIFLLQLMVGPNRGKDDVSYISDGLAMLGCPVAALSKSQLKTLSIPHVLPVTITALCWLACLVEETMGLRREHFHQPNICEIEQEVENETWESYKRLFYSQIAGEDVNLMEELDNYRKQLVEIYDENWQISVAEIEAELEEKLKYKESVYAQEDPRKGVLSVLGGQDEIMAQEKRRIEDFESRLKKYENLTALQTDETFLASTLARLLREVQCMKDCIAMQKISKLEADQKVNEIQDMKNRKAALTALIENLQKKLKAKEQFLRNDQQRFYEVCRGFSVLELYNNAAKNWSDVIPQLDRNPFDVATMEVWLRGVKQKLSSAKRILEKRREHYVEEEKQYTVICSNLDTNIYAVEEEISRVSAELSFQGHEQREKVEQISSELTKLKQQVDASASKVQQLTQDCEDNNKTLMELEKENEADDQEVAKLTSELAELETQVEQLHGQCRLAEAETQAYLLALVTDARSKVYAPLTELDDPNFRLLAKKKAATAEIPAKKDEGKGDANDQPGSADSGGGPSVCP